MADDVTRDLDARAARAAAPGDAAAGPLAVAATVVVLRDGPGGPEVLMIERPDRGSFAGAWVFPGGKVDPGDLGDTAEAVARAAAVRETREETGLLVAREDLVLFALWDPPRDLPLRIRTWFFFVRDPGGALDLAADEAVASMWARPAEVLERHARGGLTLYPPTWVTLHEIAGQQDVDDVLAVARLGGPRRYETVARTGPHGQLLLWREDAEYDTAGAGGSARHRLDLSVLPWVYTRAE